MPDPLIRIWYLPPIARKRRLVPRQILIVSFRFVVVSLLSLSTSQFENSNPTPSPAITSVTWMKPRCSRPTAEPLKLTYTLPTPALTEKVPSLSPPSANPAPGAATTIACTVIQTSGLIDARRVEPAREPSQRGLRG